MSSINFRRRYHLYLTNTKDNSAEAGPYDLALPRQPSFKGTLGQILEEIAEFRRLSGGCDIAYKVLDPRTGQRVDMREVRDELSLRDCQRRNR